MIALPTVSSLSGVLAELDSLVDWERRDRAGMQVDVKPACDLLARLDNPQRRFLAVHVAGTKGKGSVCALIDAGLRHAGYVTGRYASPHVDRVNERVVLNGCEIADHPLAGYLARAMTAQKDAARAGTAGRHASWFDIWTVAAFTAFAEHKVEWAVIECGIGGRCDSTNAIDADIAVLTNVDLEHTALLGETREAIAREKLGILRAGRPLVTGVRADSDIGRCVAEVAGTYRSKVVYASAAAHESLQAGNMHVANAVLDLLGEPRIDRLRADSVHLPGRLEIVTVAAANAEETETMIPVVLDGAHVASSLRAVLRDLSSDQRLRGACAVVMGLGRDKDALGMLQALLPLVERGVSIFTTASRRGAPHHEPADLARSAQVLGFAARAVQQPSDALQEALRHVERFGPGGWILVTGSLHLVGAVRPSLSANGMAPLHEFQQGSYVAQTSSIYGQDTRNHFEDSHRAQLPKS